MIRLTRDEYGLSLAQAAAGRADCTRRQVGAVIVAEDGSVVSRGYNGLASGRPVNYLRATRDATLTSLHIHEKENLS